MTTANLPATPSDVATLLDPSSVDSASVESASVESATLDTAPACGACRHPLAAHDALGLRFCAATVSSELSRGCICR